MKSFPLIAFSAIFLSSCAICHHLPTVEYRDSIRTEYRERIIHDTVVFSVSKESEKKTTRDTSSYLENTYAESYASVSGGYLTHTLATKPQSISIPVAVEVKDTNSTHSTAATFSQVPEPVYIEKPLSSWQRVRLRGFWVLLAIIGTAVLVTLRHPWG